MWVHPLGPGPVLHLGGSSPPKIKFLQHPSSYQSPQHPNPEKSPTTHSAQNPMAPGPSEACSTHRARHTTRMWEQHAWTA